VYTTPPRACKAAGNDVTTGDAVDDARPRPPEGDWLGTPYLRLERHGSAAHLVVDRPEVRNAMTGAMYFGARYAVDLVNRDPDLGGLIITGTGDVFIPGGDLGASTVDDWGGPALLGMDNVPFDAIRYSAKPVVSAVNGIVQGGGLLMAIMSDVCVASERATFRAPELFRGIADTGYAAYLPAQIGPARAKDMLFTGRVVNAQEAVDWGLVTRVVAHEDLMAEATKLLQDCLRNAPLARAEVKRIISDGYGTYDRMTMQASLSGPEAREGWEAFAARRSPAWVPSDLPPRDRL
jgi:enoyl-CoA hydratase/carnithine racemase